MKPLRKSTDRGATPFFHGRKPILDSFEKRLLDDKKNNEGTTFIVQGPPGIGKTALLAECLILAKKRWWQVAEIDPECLWNAVKLGEALGLSTKKITRMKTFGGGGKVGGSRGEFGAQFEATSQADLPVATPLSLIQKRKKPLLLILDEAQLLGEDKDIRGEYFNQVSYLLNRIHNGKVGKPVILLAGGLGMTDAAFAGLGISRMAEKCMFDMRPLEVIEERRVVQDWLEAGKAKGDTTAWIDAITQETYLWPRHVDSYARTAYQVLGQNSGRMTGELLRSVMEEGRQNRLLYYKARLRSFTEKERRSIARILLVSSGGTGIKQEVAVAQLDREYGMGKGEELFFRAVRKGVFHYDNETGCYSAPIPSMREYIIKNFPPKEMDSPTKE